MGDLILAPRGHQIQVGDELRSRNRSIYVITRTTETLAIFGPSNYDRLNRVWQGEFSMRDGSNRYSRATYALYTESPSIPAVTLWYRVENKGNHIHRDTLEVIRAKGQFVFLKGGNFIIKSTSLTECFENEAEANIYAVKLLEKMKLDETEKYQTFIKRIDKDLEVEKKRLKKSSL